MNPEDIELQGAAEKLLAAAAPTFTWHSTSVAEDGRLLVLFEDDGGGTWAFTIDTARALAGQHATFARVD